MWLDPGGGGPDPEGTFPLAFCAFFGRGSEWLGTLHPTSSQNTCSKGASVSPDWLLSWG
jgi:hypothetical protein